jgi:hypothetical protein
MHDPESIGISGHFERQNLSPIVVDHEEAVLKKVATLASAELSPQADRIALEIDNGCGAQKPRRHT